MKQKDLDYWEAERHRVAGHIKRRRTPDIIYAKMVGYADQIRPPTKRRTGARCRVYVLLDPQGKIFYVGQTRADPPEHRFYEHLTELSDKSKKQRRLVAIFEAGGRPKFQILDSDATWDTTEKFWIKCLRNNGIALTN